MGDADFASAFMKFRGEDPHELPDYAKEQMAKLGVKRCTMPTPCYLQGEGTLCACMKKMKRWRIFWEKVKLDTSGVTFPTNLLDSAGIGAVSPIVGPFHQPVFVFVCPGCGKRDECITFNLGYPQLVPTAPPDWLRMTVYRKPIDIATMGGVSVKELEVCSDECSMRMQAKHPKEWDFGLLTGARSLDDIKGEALDRFASGLDAKRKEREGDIAFKKRLRTKVFPKIKQLVEERERRPKMYKLNTLSGADLDALAREMVGAERWGGETDAQLRHRVKTWLKRAPTPRRTRFA